MIAYFEPVTQTSPSRSRRQDREEITQAAKGVAQPSKACQGYQEGYRRFSWQKEVNLFYRRFYSEGLNLFYSVLKDVNLFYLFSCSEIEIGIVKNVIFVAFRLVRTT